MRAAALLVATLILVTAVGYFLPDQVEMRTTVVTLDASAAELYPFFNDREQHRRIWRRAATTVGVATMPPMTLGDVGGPAAGVGSRICFCLTGEGLGPIVGRLRSLLDGVGVITESDPGRRVVYEIDWGYFELRRTVELEEAASGTTRVTWSEEAIGANPLVRYVLLDDSWFPNFEVVVRAAGELAAPERPR